MLLSNMHKLYLQFVEQHLVLQHVYYYYKHRSLFDNLVYAFNYSQGIQSYTITLFLPL